MSSTGTSDPPAPVRAIRSFVLRQGRITAAQQLAFTRHWPRYGLDYTARKRDFAAEFGRVAPLTMEIGFGNGEQLLHSALTAPERDFIGVEVHRPGVGRLMNALAEQKLYNVRIYAHDAVEVLRQEIAERSIDEIRIYFPDPWHKKRHHKRRLIQPAFLGLLAARVRGGGRLHLATDWTDYAEQMRDTLGAATDWRIDPEHTDPRQRPPWRIETRFERRGLGLGHEVWDFVYRRD